MTTGHQPPRIVLCGSMTTHALMSEVADHLRGAGFDPVVPSADRSIIAQGDLRQQKRRASKQHMDHIVSNATSAVLVVNVDRGNTANYVGPNAFAEIAVAFANDRPVYLLQDVPAAYADELCAWGVTPLRGDLGPMLHDLFGGASADATHRMVVPDPVPARA